MVGNKDSLERPERVEPDVQRDAGAAHAGSLERHHELGGEVQAGGRCRRRPRRLRVDRLVAIRRGRAIMNIGRQRRLAGAGHNQQGVPREPHDARAALEPLPHLDPVAAAEHERFTQPDSPRRADERLPSVGLVRQRAQREDLGGTTVCPRCRQAARDDARVVDDKQVAGVKQFADLVEGAIDDCRLDRGRGRAIQDEEARGIPRLDRNLGDRLGGKVVGEVLDSQGRRRVGVGHRPDSVAPGRRARPGAIGSDGAT